MSGQTDTKATIGAPAHSEVKVWDPFVRVFHWAVVAGFFIAYFTEDDLMDLHVLAGYTVAALVLARIVWGFIGTRHARFVDFVRPPRAVFAHLDDVLNLRGPRYIGHTPAGGAMIIALLIMLVLISVSGLLVYGMEEHAGPLAQLVAGWPESAEDFLEEAHEVFANLTVLLVVIHVIGVIWESMLHHESLVRAMFTGRKRAE